MLGKWKATIQFAALTHRDAAPRRDDRRRLPRRVGHGLRRDRHGLVGRRLPAEVLRLAAHRPREPRLRHGRQRGDRRRARRAPRGARRRGRRARALGRGRGRRCRAAAPQVARGDVLDEAALVRGMEGAELAFHVAGINAFCVDDPEPMRRVNVDGAVAAVRAAAAAGVPRLVHTSSAATLGEAPGTVGREDTPHRGWYLSTYERTKTEGERAVLAAAARDRPGRRVREPVLGPGAGPRRRHGALPARLPRRPHEGLRPDQREPGRHRRLRRGPPAGRRARAGRASATCSTG